MAGKSYFKSDLSSTATAVRTKRTLVKKIFAMNVNSTDAFLQIFDAAAAADVTLGTTTPAQSYLIPKGDGTARGAHSVGLPDEGLPLDNGLVIAATTTVASSGAPSSNIEVNMVLAPWGS